MIKINIDDKEYEAKVGSTVLDVALENNIEIPTLCFLKGINKSSDCRMCLVSVDGSKKLVPSCKEIIKDNMSIKTSTDDIINTRKFMLDLLLSNHNFECEKCTREGKCELKKLAFKLNMDLSKYTKKDKCLKDDSSVSIVRDNSKCILCKRCVSTCKNVQNIASIDVVGRGIDSKIGTAFDAPIKDVNCTYCGQCINSCPTAALHEKEELSEVIEKLKDENTLVYVQTAPSIRAALGEEFGIDYGTNVTGKMVTALKKLGFDKVFDTNVGADFTIMEEASELVDRITNNKPMPMFTSCSPAWVRLLEMYYPEFIPNLSSCKSPHQMLGNIIKTYYAKKESIDPKKIYNVSVMPCTSKKFEKTRENMKEDVDAVITTRELARLIKRFGIDFKSLEETNFDNPLGEATGAGAIFGVTGGVMEAALRTAKDLLGDVSEKLEFTEVRGENGIKKASISLNNKDYTVVVVSGLKNARIMLDKFINKEEHFDFLEVMACPGGCVMGGGQPLLDNKTRSIYDIRKLRSDALYSIDEKSTYRKSHENPILQKIYLEYIGKPGKGKSHDMLHTSFEKREKYKINI